MYGIEILKIGKEIYFVYFFEFENYKKDVKLSKVIFYIVVD